MFIFIVLILSAFSPTGAETLFNFTANDTVDSFVEVSDTVRSVGMSKADISILESESTRRAVLFTLLNPQSNSACFAGVETEFNPQLSWAGYQSIALESRGQGMYNNFKVVIQDDKSIGNSSISFEHYFISQTEFAYVSMPLHEFKCSYRGNACAETVNLSAIVSMGLQAAGGVYEDSYSNFGVASLELNFIELLPV